MCCAIGIPQRKGGVVFEIATIHLTIGPTIVAVNIAEHRRGEHRMIHGRVESAACSSIVGCDNDFTQLFIPCLVSLSHRATEVPRGQFGCDIGSRIIFAHGRNTHFHQQRFIVIGSGKHGQTVALARSKGYGTRELGHEIHALVFRPTCGVAITRQLCGRILFERALRHLVPTDALR